MDLTAWRKMPRKIQRQTRRPEGRGYECRFNVNAEGQSERFSQMNEYSQETAR
jgi:hypothetical protein